VGVTWHSIVRALCLGVLLTSLSGCSGIPASQSSNLKKIVIVHSNDIHGRAWPFLREDGKWLGGYAAQARLIEQIRQTAEKERAAFFLFSAGDVNTGVPESDFSDAEPDIKSMNLIGYDAMVIGNHDLDKGLETLQKQIKWAQFPVLAANLKIKSSHRTPWQNSLVLEKSGLRLGMIGITTDQILNLILPKYSKKLSVQDPISVTKRELTHINKNGADIVVVLSHLGLAQSGLGLHQHVVNDDRNLARNIPDIDLIIGGHSHTFLDSGQREGNTLIVQAGYRGDFLGKVELLWDPQNRKVVSKKASLLEVNPINGSDPRIEETIKRFKTAYEADLSKPVFEAPEMIQGQRGRSQILELPLGNLICDALKTEMKTDFAFFNSGGIRSNLPKGLVRKRDILEAFPFRNSVATGTLKGKEVIALLNDGVNRGKLGGGVLQVSGLRYEIRDDKVVGAWVGENPIEPSKIYTFATNSYVIAAGDKLKTMKLSKNIILSSKSVDEILMSFLKSSKMLFRRETPRILAR